MKKNEKLKKKVHECHIIEELLLKNEREEKLHIKYSFEAP